MATNKPTDNSPIAPGSSPRLGRRLADRPGRGQLWQAPAFFAGLLILVVVCLVRPTRQGATGLQAERDLAAARQLLDQPDGDAARALALAGRVLDQMDRYPQRAGEAHYLLGSAHLRLADRPGPAAPDHTEKARRHLEQAADLGVPEDDRLSLTYRLGKALYLTGEDPKRVIALLSQSVGRTPDNPAEGYALLTHAYLRLPVPDLDAALEANREQLQLPTEDVAVLAPARLLRGELLLRKQDRAEAHRVLEAIKPPAPRALVARARYLRAAACQEEGRWAEAARLWEEVLADRAAPPAEPARALYFLGLCYRHLDRPDEAARAWEKDGLWKNGSDEGTAAALGLAWARLQLHRPDAALEAFEKAVQRVQTPAEWVNALLPLAQARAAFEQGCQLLRDGGEYLRAIDLARLYERLAPPGAAAFLHAQAAEDFARQLESSPDGRAAGPFASGALFQEAAAKYEASSEAALIPADQARKLWRSAECYAAGQNPEGAARVLGRFIKVEQAADRLGHAWFLLGEAYRALRQEAKAVAAYELSTRYRGPFEFRARYQMAVMLIAQGAHDRAGAVLKRNLELLKHEPEPDAEAEEKSLFAMGELLLQMQKYQDATFPLELVLKKYATPDNPRAAAGRFQLAECYRQLAAQADEKLRLPFNKSDELQKTFLLEYRGWLEQAAGEYEKLADLLAGRRQLRPLTPEEEKLYRQAAFATAEARTYLGQYAEAVRLYQGLAERYRGRVECLHALAGVLQCHGIRKDLPAYRATLEQMGKVLAELEEAVFSPSVSSLTRQQWEQKLAEWGKWSGS